jgi:hypothetical protein
MVKEIAIDQQRESVEMDGRTLFSQSSNGLARFFHLSRLDELYSDRTVIKTHRHKLWPCGPSPKTCEQPNQAGYSRYRNRNDAET